MTASPSSGTAPYPVPSSGPVTAAPSSYGVSNFPSAGVYTISGNGSDSLTTTIHLTSSKHVTITRPRLSGCTVNAPGAKLLYWNSATYSYSLAAACPILPESSGGTILATIVTTAPYTFPVSLHAASTQFINFTNPGPTSVGNYTTTVSFTNYGTTQTFTESAYTTTYTHGASTETLTGSGITTTIIQSAETLTGSGTAGTQTYTVTGNTQIATETPPIYATPAFAGPTDVLRPDITYHGVTYAYTATTPTPYVFFSVLEVTQSSSTSTITVPVPFLSAYPGNPYVDWSGNATATGALPPNLLGQLAAYENVNISNCAVGTFRGEATLDVAVSLYASITCAAPARGEKTASGLGPISANPGGPSISAEPLTTTVAPSAALPTSQSSAPPPAGPAGPPTASSSPKALTPGTDSPSPLSSPPPGSSPPQGNSPPGPVTTAPATQPPLQQTAPQAANSPTTTQGLGGIIMSGLGGTQAPYPGTQAPSPGTQAANPPPAPTTLTVGNVPVVVSSNSIIINSQTFSQAPGLPPVTTTVGSQPIVINLSQVIAGGTTVAIPNNANLPAVSIVPAPQPLVITIGNSPITANPQSQLIVSGQTLAPGGPVITVGGTPLSLGPSASSVVIGGSLIALQHSAAAPLPTVAGQQMQTAGNGNIIIPGIMTLSPGANAATISGTVVSVMLNGAGLVIGGSTVALPAGAPTSLPTVAGQQIQVAPNGNLVLPGGTTASAGGAAATISGTPVSVLANGAGVVIGTSTIPLPVGAASPLPTVGGQQLQKGPDGNIIIPHLTTIEPGGTPATISGTVISVASNGASLVVGGSTIDLAPATTPLPSITFGESTITANSKTQLFIAGQMLSPGSVITVSGTPVSLAPGASSVVIGGTIFSLSPTATEKSLPSITFGGSTITENSNSQFIIAGQTLSPGSAITISGTVISLAPGASDVVMGGSTAFLATPTGSSGNVTTFTGAAATERIVRGGLTIWMTVGIGMFLGIAVL